MLQEKKLWPAVELAEAVGVPLSLLRRKAVFWVNEGVITESRQKDNVMIYLAADQYSKDSGRRNQERVGGDDESSSAIALAEEQLQEEMMVYESFVVGMLTNHSEMRLDKIHNMLKMFAPGFDKTSEQLAAFMTKLVREEKLTCDGGVYRKSNNK